MTVEGNLSKSQDMISTLKILKNKQKYIRTTFNVSVRLFKNLRIN